MHSFELSDRRQRCSASPAAMTAVCAVMVCLACLVYLMLAVTFGDGAHGVTGWFVTDGITLWTTAREYQHASVQEVIEIHQAAAGLGLLNAWLVGVHDYVPALFNVLLLSAVLAVSGTIRPWWPVFLLFAVPYYLVASPLPSKDIAVAALVVASLGWFLSTAPWRLAGPLLVCLLMFFVRDGYAVILAVSLIVVALGERLGLRPWFVLLGFGVACSVFWLVFESIIADSFLYARAIGVAQLSETLPFETTSSPLGYVIRAFGNATNLAFRPVVLDTQGHPHVVSIAYWVSGLMLLVTLWACVRAVASEGPRSDQRLGAIALLSLLAVSVTPYVQPRYLLPLCLMLPMFSFAGGIFIVRTCFVTVPLSMLFAGGYWLSGNYPPPAEIISFSWSLP